MPVIPNNVDWSATAAWIALVISIIGTIVGPIVTTILTNQHQLKLRELDIAHKNIEEYNKEKFATINDFISSVGRCIANPTPALIEDVGAIYYNVYLYVPNSLHKRLNDLHDCISDGLWTNAGHVYREIALRLTELLKEDTPQTL